MNLENFHDLCFLGSEESEKKFLLKSYNHGFRGFTAMLTENEESVLSGKIVVCVNDDPMVSKRIKKLVVENAKAKGVILIDYEGEDSPLDSGTYPFAQVGQSIRSHLLHYINSTKNSTSTILASEEIGKFKPAPVVATFSSRGPGSLTENILKPDIMAPGVAISAAMYHGLTHPMVHLEISLHSLASYLGRVKL